MGAILTYTWRQVYYIMLTFSSGDCNLWLHGRESCRICDEVEMDVHLYRVELALPPGAVRQLETLLSPDELARADRFAHARLRRRFVAGRGQLRLLLARYLHAVPEEIVFAYSPSGKPTLGTAPAGPPPLEFNVDH